MKFLSILTVLIGLASASNAPATQAYSQAELDRVASSMEWYRLMHYRRSFPFYPLRSELDGAGFFFSPEGHRDPKAELIATVHAFQSRTDERFGKLKQPPTCAFPARLNFLKRALSLKVPEPPCPQLDDYMRKFNPHSTTLVFSSAYPENPGSMFGHTFLRINSKAGEADVKRKDLLDYAISYAAVVGPDENPFAFMVLGLTGGYLGQFSMEEYYKKVNEYNNGESRDVWEYDLSLTEAETRTLLLHAWEIETNSNFNYFFFDENCAYELLTLLEVAKPEWDISQFKIYIIPSETIKRLADVPGAITRIRFRPSLRRRMLRRFDLLDPASKAQALAVYDGELHPDRVNDPRVLEATTAYLYYRQKELQDGFPTEKKKILADSLLRRSELPTLPETADTEASPDRFSQPELGHYPFNLGVHFGRQEKRSGTLFQNFIDLRWKFAYHDLLNSDVGYIPYSQIDFPAFTLRHDLTRNKFRLEEIHFLSMTSLSPMTFIEKRASWHFRLNALPPLDRNCLECKALHLEGGVGASVQPLGRRWILYAFLTPAAEFSGEFADKLRFIPHAEFSTIVTPTDQYKIQVSSRFYWDVFQNDRQKTFSRLEWNQSYALSQSWDVRTFAHWIIPGKESSTKNHQVGLNLNYFFQ